MKITGQILKENRERKGVTISEVSLSTKITIKTLHAIENGDPLNLPPKTFLRGFVRSYAVFLGLDPDEILRTFHEEMGSTLTKPASSGDPNPAELNAAATEEVAKSTTPNGQSSVTTKVAIKDATNEGSAVKAMRPERTRPKANDAEATLRNEPSLLSRGLIFGGIILLIILIVFLKGKMDSYESERVTDPGSVETAAPAIDPGPEVGELLTGDDPKDPPQVDEESAGIVAAPTPAPSATPTPSATPKPTPTPSATPKPTPTPSATPKPTPSPSATPKPTPTPSATPKPTPSPSATPKPTPSPSATPKPTPTPSATPKPTPTPSATPKPTPAVTGRNSEVLIEALDQVDIEAAIDGEAPRNLRLRADQVQSIKVKKKVILKFSNGGAVNLIVNGIDRGVPGDLGKPLKVELP